MCFVGPVRSVCVCVFVCACARACAPRPRHESDFLDTILFKGLHDIAIKRFVQAVLDGSSAQLTGNLLSEFRRIMRGAPLGCHSTSVQRKLNAFSQRAFPAQGALAQRNPNTVDRLHHGGGCAIRLNDEGPHLRRRLLQPPQDALAQEGRRPHGRVCEPLRCFGSPCAREQPCRWLSREA
jgi:hypothetical protein